MKIANETVEGACRGNEVLRMGLNMYKGTITFKSVADAFGLGSFHKPVEEVLQM